MAKILIMAGGTGGHVMPALAVAKKLASLGVEIHWLGTSRGLEASLVPANHFKLHEITVRGIRGRSFLRKLLISLQTIAAVYACKKIIKRVKPDVALGMGGYASGPGGVAAKLKKIPLIIHEQNSVAGLTNQTLARFAVVLQAFPGAFAHQFKALTVGNPLREAILQLDKKLIEGLSILVLGGSQGAKVLNDIVPQALAKLPPSMLANISVEHICGKTDEEQVKQAYAQINLTANVLAFTNEIAALYAKTNLVIARAGAMTVSEIMQVGVASILVPYPYAVDDHQTKNAKYLVEAGAAILINQKDFTSASLSECLTDFYQHPDKLQSMGIKAKSLAKPDATDQVTEVCLRLSRSGNSPLTARR